MPISFRPLTFAETNPVLAGYGMYQDVDAKALQNALRRSTLPYAGPQAAEDLQKAKLFNRFYPRQAEAGIAGAELANEAQRLKNPYIQKEIQARLAQMQAQRSASETSAAATKYGMDHPEFMYGSSQLKDILLAQQLQDKYPGASEDVNRLIQSSLLKQQNLAQNAGLSSMFAPQRAEYAVQSSIARDNPEFANNPNLLWDASNALKEGRNTLSNGQPFNVSANTQTALGALGKSLSDASARNQMTQGLQAEAEVKVLKPYIDDAVRIYGDTVFGMTSPKEVLDEFGGEKNQRNLGKLIAAQQLLFDQSALFNKMQGVQPGVTSLEHMMKLSGQVIDVAGYKVSKEARAEASRIISEAMEKMLQARQNVGIQSGLAAFPNAMRLQSQKSSLSGSERFTYTNDEINQYAKASGLSPDQVRELIAQKEMNYE